MLKLTREMLDPSDDRGDAELDVRSQSLAKRRIGGQAGCVRGG